MSKKMSFDELPQAVASIIEKLDSKGSVSSGAPELEARLTRLERKMEQVLTLLAPEKPTMEMQAVCRVLKLSPKSVNDLEDAGVLVSRKDGRSRLFDEAAVIKYFRGTKQWKEAIAEPAPAAEKTAKEKPVVEVEVAVVEKRKPGRPKAEKTVEKRKPGRPKSATPKVDRPAKASIVFPEGRQRIDMKKASELLMRKPHTLYQMISLSKIPFHKDGHKVFFFSDELSEWSKSHHPRKRTK